jgi:hypothetical protein
MKLPDGTGIVEPMMEKINCNQWELKVGDCTVNVHRNLLSRTKIVCNK